MPDVLLVIEPDGGNIIAENGAVSMTDSVETMIAMCLFGGNDDDAGTDATANKQYWGNFIEEDPLAHLRSRTQAMIQSIPLIPANLKRIEDAAVIDLAPLVDSGVAQSVTVSASIPEPRAVLISINGTDANGIYFSKDYLRKVAG